MTFDPLIVVAALLWNQGRVLLTRRPPGSWMEGYWEFPGGKLGEGETLEEALVREIDEELGVEIEVNQIREAIYHAYDSRRVLLLFYECTIRSGQPTSLEGQEMEWFKPRELREVSLLPADLPLVPKLIEDGEA